jgi:hypothetical protein
MDLLNLSLPRLLLVVSLFMISACSSQHATYAPDGHKGFVVTCGGFLNSYASCLVKAGRACGSRGYETLKGGEDDRELLIECKTAN